MRKTILIAIAGVLLVLTGCFEKEPQTVTWYKEHDQERNAMLDKCKDNPGKYHDDPDCINAARALHEKMAEPSEFQWGTSQAAKEK